MTRILLFGASGSIGKQTLDVMKKNPQDFDLVGFTVGKRSRCISSIVSKFKNVKAVYLLDKKKIKYYENKFPHIKFVSGELKEVCHLVDFDMAVNALVGFSGLLPSIEVLKMDKKLALANKESLVVAGELINDLLKNGHGELFPIDSEHSALWKCLKVDSENVDKLMLTASGGAFRNLSRSELKDVKASDALKHPTWKMGAKITIDCATMVNKCFEIIEAGYLYNYPYSKIGVTLHDESILHSYVKYNDGINRGEISKPDMRNPIKFALYEGRIPFETASFKDLNVLKNLHFHEFDITRYPMVKYAEVVLSKKGTYGATLNASNEVAVAAYLKDQIRFLDIERIIDTCMKEHHSINHPTIEDLVKVNNEVKTKAERLVKELSR